MTVIRHVSPQRGIDDEDLTAFLGAAGARFRLLEHPPEGRTAEASVLRGHPLAAAAKSIVVRVRLDRRRGQYVVCVVPGDRRVDLSAVRDLYAGSKVGFATTAVAEDLTGCVSGTVIPFSFRDDLALVTDPDLLKGAEMFFNAARLHRSIALDCRDYVSIARPRVARICE